MRRPWGEGPLERAEAVEECGGVGELVVADRDPVVGDKDLFRHRYFFFRASHSTR